MQKKVSSKDQLLATVIFELLHFAILYVAYIPLSAVVLVAFVFCVISVFTLLQSGDTLSSANPLFSSLLELIPHQGNISYTEKDVLLLFSKISFIFSTSVLLFLSITKKRFATFFTFSNNKKIMLVSLTLTILMVVSQLAILSTGTTELMGMLIFFWALALMCYFLHISILWFANLFSLFQKKVLSDNLKL